MPRLFNLEVRCPCGQTLVIPERVVRLPYPLEHELDWKAEIQDEALPMILEQGWALRQTPAGGSYVVCPACSKLPQYPPLPPYDPRLKCPACGNRKLTTRFCDGRSRMCRAGVRDHLHRSCARCGYDVIQATKLEKTHDDADGTNEDAGSAQRPTAVA